MRSNLIPVAYTVGGQAVWALSQAAVVITLSSGGLHGLIGVYVLGLAIFAPLCLMGSLNLRTSIALGRDTEFASVREALLLRLGVVATALLITLIAIAFAAPTQDIWAVAALLVAVRAADQISDVMTGFYQKDGRQDLIGRSFLVRGLFSLVPFLLVVYLTGDYIAASALTLVSALAAAFCHDVLPSLWKGRSRTDRPRLRSRLGDMVKRSATVAPYPLLDNLHFNSFRYAMFLGTSPEYLGLVGVAQTLFVPFQLLVAALNLPFLPRAGRLVDDGRIGAFRKLLVLGLATGFSIAGTFLLAAWLMPEAIAERLFGADADTGTNAVILVAVAMLLVPANGFSASALIATTRSSLYTLAPVAGLAVFAALILVMDRSVEQTIALAFLASYVIRLAFTTGAALTATPSQSRVVNATLRGPG